mmetsp:Transcript_12605/g.32080  ORF Transcript_12605/g.32080 Transcript_12605/m.32080 type:complete len:246 (-) Transcript_12605:1565-2302(-)
MLGKMMGSALSTPFSISSFLTLVPVSLLLCAVRNSSNVNFVVCVCSLRMTWLTNISTRLHILRPFVSSVGMSSSMRAMFRAVQWCFIFFASPHTASITSVIWLRSKSKPKSVKGDDRFLNLSEMSIFSVMSTPRFSPCLRLRLRLSRRSLSFASASGVKGFLPRTSKIFLVGLFLGFLLSLRGVLPFLSLKSGSAPFSSSATQPSTAMLRTAYASGVMPSRFWKSMVAPLWMRYVTRSQLLVAAA